MKTYFSMKSVVYALGAVLLSSFVLTSCLKDKNDVNNNSAVSGLMAFNLAPDKNVNIGLSGASLTQTPLSYTSYTGSYLTIYSGNRSFESYDANVGSVLDRTNFNFADSQYYSAFVIGKNGSYRNVIVHDNFDSLKAVSGKAFVRYIYAIPDSANSTVIFNAGGSDIVNQSAKFGNISEFTEVPAGNVTITVNGGASINTNRTINFEERKVYTVLLVGVPGSSNESDSLQIRYITHGTLDEEAARVASARVQNVN